MHELISFRARPLPSLAWPRWLGRSPHVLAVLAAVSLSLTGADTVARLLAIAHAATLVVALRWPVTAWWLSLGFVVGIAVGHPPSHDNQLWAWLVQASVVLLLALRLPPLVAAVAAGAGPLAAVALKWAGAGVGSWRLVLASAVLSAVALLLGVLARERRRDRERLAEQIAATARERALRTVWEERARIARELHDVVAHHMSVIALQAEAAPHRTPDPPPVLVDRFGTIRTTALEGLAELRRLLGLLRPEGVTGPAGSTAPQPSLGQLDALTEQVRAAGGNVRVRVEGRARPLPPGVELSAYRIVQEALSNVLRHAPGAEAGVVIGYRRATLTVRVRNGAAAGSPAVPSPGAGHGITGMRERAAMLGGELAAGPVPGGGYEVSAVLPVPAAGGVA
ncbi:histidine kinase [Streptomyces sp. DSM 44915]|uniref:histidine kinase n=1 Tax=Streptomyces chisholmiae TaxID=3075540 RepID=A0ABU2JQJ3_9ACTN|nr:histidine kinase [Streptomyces sp. DSM 44915]MDT0267252.1 histidine kinase [Streptomyces sp. DSM 44915]